MWWIQLFLDIMNLLESADKSELASRAAWVVVALFAIATLFKRDFGLTLLPLYDKLLLVKFFAALATVAGLVLSGHEVPIIVSGLLAWVTFNQLALIWWDRVGRKLH